MPSENAAGAPPGRVEVVSRRRDLEQLRPAWRALAERLSRPAGLPAWVCGAGSHPRPHVVALFDDRDLVGLAPLQIDRLPFGRLAQPLGFRMAEGFGWMAEPGYEATLAIAARRSLRDRTAGLAATRLWSMPLDERWVRSFAAAAAPRRTVGRALKVAPFADLAQPTADAWVAARSKNFRRSAARAERGLERQGGSVVVVDDPRDLDPALLRFFALHHARWTHRGGSAVLTAEVEAGVRAAAPALLDQRHLRLWRVEVRGESVGSLLCLVAGRRYLTWLGGYDDRGAEAQAGFLLRLAALRDAYDHDCEVLDLGTGRADFKQRFATGERVVETALVPEANLGGAGLALALRAHGALARSRRARR